MTNVLKASIDLHDFDTARDILKILKAPVTQENVDNLKALVSEVGDMYLESYNQMLIDVTNDKLASYNAKCACGRSINVSFTKSDFDEIQGELQ